VRSKKDEHGRKWLVRHKKTRKTEKAEKPLPPPIPLCSSTPQQERHQMPIKGEVQVHSIHSPPSAASHFLHPPTTPPEPSSSTVQHTTFPPTFLYSSVATRTDLRLNQELHQELDELPQEPQEQQDEQGVQPAEDGHGCKELKPKIFLIPLPLLLRQELLCLLCFLCPGKPSVTNSQSLSLLLFSVLYCGSCVVK
jgi:hypothetical protein